MVKLHNNIVNEASNEGNELRKFNLSPGLREIKCCSVTGLPATEYCPYTAVYYFTAGEEPTQSCYIHTGITVESSTDTDSQPESSGESDPD